MKTTLLLATFLVTITWILASNPGKPGDLSVTRKCVENEVYSEIAIRCPPQTCEAVYANITCGHSPPQAACNCIKDHVRNSTGHCIPYNECPLASRCPRMYEEWSDCSLNQATCKDLNPKPPNPSECKGGCVCQSGYIRNDIWFCIPDSRCPPKCPAQYEKWSECSNNQPTCENRNPEPVNPSECKADCVCEDGYVRNADQECMPVEICDCCPKDEKWVECEQRTCMPKTCDDLGFPVPCPDDDIWPEDCEKGCICKNGYVRDCSGTCIPKSQCPSCGGDDNATGGCGFFCKTCQNQRNVYVSCPGYCLDNGCACKPGYIYDTVSKKCVSFKDCPYDNEPKCGVQYLPLPCLKEHEKWVDCLTNVCAPVNCTDLGRQLNCTQVNKFYCCGACICKEGYLKDAKGDCIPIDKCPGAANSCGANEVYLINTNECQRSCNDLKPGAPPSLCPPSSGCFCKPNYVRLDPNGKGPCVLKEKCQCEERLPCLKIHEKWVDCLANVCSSVKCADLGYQLNCTEVDNTDCCGACICEAGYLKDAKGDCVPINECPSCAGDRNATSGCGNYCKQSCSDYKDTNKRCGFGCIRNSCKCRPGYVFHELLKECVLPDDCPLPCDDPNAERVTCATHCPATCEKPEPDPCPYAACTKFGCQCKKGYILSKIEGKCIKIDECPDCACNGDPNARIKKCPDFCAPSCDDPEPKPCDIPCYPVGCECRPGYIKSKKISGKCIKPNKCPKGKARCGANEEYLENTKARQRSCKDAITPSGPPSQCPPSSGCFCKSGFFRQKPNGKGPCISKESCTAAANGCGANEVYLVNTNECQRSCKDIKPGAPPSLCPPSSGCFCKPDFVRLNPNGKGPCVPTQRCQ